MSLSERQARAERNFQNSVVNLRKLLPKESFAVIDQVDFPDFSMEDEVEKSFNGLMEAIATRTRSTKENPKVNEVAKKWVRAFFPFARIVLIVGKSASAVSIHTSVVETLDTDSKCMWGCV